MAKFNSLKTKERLPEIIHATELGWWVNKPAHWLSVDATHATDVPVVARWLERDQKARVWPTHRIDRETSGVLFFARSPEAHRAVNGYFEKHQAKKEYRFLAQGSPSLPSWIEKSPIHEQSATTQFEAVERFGDFAFLGMARPRTGRRHQIRIHLQVKGHMILGDREYGGMVSLPGGEPFARFFLHAAALEFPGQARVEAPLPDDLQEVARLLRERNQSEKSLH